MQFPELQTIHRQFLALSQIARDRFDATLGGKLLLRCQLDDDGLATIIAGSAAGAASLSVDADADRLREGLRAGFVDFVVAHLDEALRILKNEVRRARAVSVGLAAEPQPCIDAMLQRGLQPDLLSAVPHRQLTLFVERGAISLPHSGATEPGTSHLEWRVTENPAPAMRRIAELASAALDAERSDTPARRRWLEQSPRYLGRAYAARQCLRMTPAEIAALVEGARAAFPALHFTRDEQPL
ncbi:MAG: hypothetical protein ACLGXA_15710 [Acidobacteriota bacterium]